MPRLIADKYREHQQERLDRFNQLKANEEELNRIFIDIYGLQDELSPEVADRDVTVYRIIDEPDAEERKMPYVLSMKDEIASLLSYMVGCMLGRYSPYVDGLLYAGGEWDYEAIHARIEAAAPGRDFYDPELGLFLPDPDGIIPITDEAYFEDDIVERTAEFVQKVYGRETLEENLAFIARALKGKGDTPREVIRSYYLNDFYADHRRTYKKRPIYWQCDSGRAAGFRALFYLHRYEPDTLGRLRADYLHRLQSQYEHGVESCDNIINSSASAAEKGKATRRKEKLQKQLEECKTYDQALAHLANRRISLDLDDGVKRNYELFQGVEVPRDGRRALKVDLLGKL